jgi:tryptophan-rich sensory protein
MRARNAVEAGKIRSDCPLYGIIELKYKEAGMRWIALLTWLGLCFAVAGVSGSWTAREISGWFRTLTRPSIAPPDWLFGPVWTLLYALMALAAWQVWLLPASTLRSWGLALFLAQLALNFAWTWIFFRSHAIGFALAEVVVLWAAIGATTLVFSQVAPAAAWLMAPYWAWVSFAAVLNAAYWRLNEVR